VLTYLAFVRYGIRAPLTTQALFAQPQMHPLSEKQEKILRFIADFARENGYPPSFREIGAAFGGIKSSTVAYYIKVLIKKGVLRQGSSKARDLKLASAATTRGLAGLGTRGYPILERVPPGKPSLIEEEIEDTLWLDERLCRSREAYLLRISGDSMIGAGIHDGDLVIVRPQRAADSGDVVVARTPNGEGTVKTLRQKRQTYSLEAENPKYASIHAPFDVVGKVMGVIRRHVK
jgi:repressor LexA